MNFKISNIKSLHLKSNLVQFCMAILLVGPHLQLDSTYMDLGTVNPDSVTEATMRFRNTGDSALLVMNVFSDCGCTVPAFSREPVSPGGEGEIKVRFNPGNRKPGYFRKALRIKSNADNLREVLIIKGRISK